MAATKRPRPSRRRPRRRAGRDRFRRSRCRSGRRSRPWRRGRRPSCPRPAGWLYEPKWDGFRCLAFRKGDDGRPAVEARPAARPLLPGAGRGLPRRSRCKTFVLDGEIVIRGRRRASTSTPCSSASTPPRAASASSPRETPASFYAFDLLVDENGQVARRSAPGAAAGAAGPACWRICLKTRPCASRPPRRSARRPRRWLRDLGGRRPRRRGRQARGLALPLRRAQRMVKVKRVRTADCVVGGFRWAARPGARWARSSSGSTTSGAARPRRLLLQLHRGGARASSSRSSCRCIEPPGFTGKAPGGPSRWSQGRSTEWEPLRPALVCEVRYDHFSGGRFRHGTKFLRWRPDKRPDSAPSSRCGFVEGEEDPPPDLPPGPLHTRPPGRGTLRHEVFS